MASATAHRFCLTLIISSTIGILVRWYLQHRPPASPLKTIDFRSLRLPNSTWFTSLH